MRHNEVFNAIRRFLNSQDGATAVEYAVILGLILLAIIAGISTVGGGTSDLWNSNSTQIGNAISTATGS